MDQCIKLWYIHTMEQNISHNKGLSIDTCYKVDGPGKLAKGKKTNTKEKTRSIFVKYQIR